jgi:predicted esterase
VDHSERNQEIVERTPAGESMSPDRLRRSWRLGVLTARPTHEAGSESPGVSRLRGGLHWPFGAAGQGSALFVPSSMPAGPVPLVVFLHGAGANPLQILPMIQQEAEKRGTLVLVPASGDATWDVIRGGFGPDVAALDQALAYVFEYFSADPGRLAIAGFSDGASYALSVGLTNGDLFSRIFAFSPGFVVPGPRSGRPFVFISHGTADRVLPIDRCSRQTSLAVTQWRVDNSAARSAPSTSNRCAPVAVAPVPRSCMTQAAKRRFRSYAASSRAPSCVARSSANRKLRML